MKLLSDPSIINVNQCTSLVTVAERVLKIKEFISDNKSDMMGK